MAKETYVFIINDIPCSSSSVIGFTQLYTVKPVCNDHFYDKINYLWFIQ